MNMGELKEFLLWCTVINYLALLLWFGGFALARDWIYRLHTRWYRLSVERFDAIHYAGMAAYKLGIFLLNLAPLIALSLMTR